MHNPYYDAAIDNFFDNFGYTPAKKILAASCTPPVVIKHGRPVVLHRYCILQNCCNNW